MFFGLEIGTTDFAGHCFTGTALTQKIHDLTNGYKLRKNYL